MQIHQVDPSNRRDVSRFLQLPFRLYRDDAHWVPPFAHEARAQLDPTRHPFYQHSHAAFFLALHGRELAGRIAVLDNSRHNAHHGARSAWFYLFEAQDDRAVSRALFAAASDWARSRGLDALWGPKGFSHLEGQGLLVEGFQYSPAMGIPYNPPYYPGLIADAGLAKKIDLLSWFIDDSVRFPDRLLRLAARVKARGGLRSVVFRSRRELRPWVPRLVDVYNRSFTRVEGFVPMTEAEGQAIGDRLLAIADPEIVTLLLKDDDLAGFVVAYPDLSAAIRRTRGRIWPTGWLELRREFRRTPWINVNGAAILEQYRGLGGNALLYAEMYHVLVDHPRYRYADVVQIQESNDAMQRDLEAIGLMPRKRHRLYERSL